MYRRIVVGYDGRDAANDALALASRLAQATDASMLLVYVAIAEPRWYRTEREYQRELRTEVAGVLEPALASIPDGIEVAKASIPSPSAARGLYEMAAEEHATLLVLGSTHHGPIGRVLIGSSGELLTMGAPCAVTVAPRGFATHVGSGFDVVGAGFSGSPESELAVESAHALAQALGARLRAIGVIESHLPGRLGSHKLAKGRAHPEQKLTKRLGRLPEGPDVERELREGAAVETLAEAAAQTDVMVIGSRAYGPMHHVLLGSVSAKLMRTTRCPLLVVPRGAPTPVEDLRAGISTGAAQSSSS
jgi:nucleotide-binding universal stress UspA family protein